jgi:O-antigen biosynthesis protein
VLYKLIRKILHAPVIRRYIKKIYEKSGLTAYSLRGPEVHIPEVSELVFRESELNEIRLNLIIPALSQRHVFGGIATALEFFKTLLPDNFDARIIIADEVCFSHSDNNEYADWNIIDLNDSDLRGKLIVCAGDRYGKSITVRRKDIFIATAWWTAIAAQKLIDHKKRFYEGNDLQSSEKFIYLIQDYEPGFYPWSSRYSLAESSYHLASVLSVFNTGILKDFFLLKGYDTSNSFVFEPILNSSLRSTLPMSGSIREKIIIVYGRPSVNRNAFEILVMSLRNAVRNCDLSEWKFYSAGEGHHDIDLGKELKLISLGKLSLEDYSKLLKKSYAGISLMISPHPSYPPIEMAAFGLKVITNTYSNKNLDGVSPFIKSVAVPSPENIAKRLIDIVNEYVPTEQVFAKNNSVYMNRFVTEKRAFDHFVPELRKIVFHE